MFYPTDKFLLFLLLPLFTATVFLPIGMVYGPFGFFPKGTDSVLEFLVLLDATLLVFFLVDGFCMPGRGRFQIERRTDRIYSVNFPHAVVLEIQMSRGFGRAVPALVADDCRDCMEPETVRHRVLLKVGRNQIAYRLRVRKRGDFRLGVVYLTCFSYLGLVRRVYVLPCVTELRVYPDLKAVSRYLLLARKSQLGRMGIRRAARMGGDNEFERLREYQADDEFRHIDWKASAKRDRMIVRTFQMNRNQNIVFMLDCGRMMTAEMGGRSFLDYAINSVLLLARIALDQGDRVGLLCFGGRVLRYVRPGTGRAQHRRLVRAAYDLFAAPEESNFGQAFRYLNSVLRQRSLVCLISNVIDDMNASLLQSYLGAISGRHLPFAVLLKHQDVEALLEEGASVGDGVYVRAAAADFLLWQRHVIQKLKNLGALTLEASPDKLDAQLINEYLWIKARKLL